jgi:hypothetical protein
MPVGGSEPQELVAFSAGIGGAAIVQTLGPRSAVAPSQPDRVMRLKVRGGRSGDALVIRQKQ